MGDVSPCDVVLAGRHVVSAAIGGISPVPGCGVVTEGKVSDEVTGVDRFKSNHAFARYNDNRACWAPQRDGVGRGVDC